MTSLMGSQGMDIRQQGMSGYVQAAVARNWIKIKVKEKEKVSQRGVVDWSVGVNDDGWP